MHNMKENVNMNTLTRLEKSSIWVPQLVFFNTEEKVTTANDNKAFTVTRSTTADQISVSLSSMFRRDSQHGFSELSVKDNIFIFEVGFAFQFGMFHVLYCRARTTRLF